MAMLLLFARSGLGEVAGAFGAVLEVSGRVAVAGEFVVMVDVSFGAVSAYSVTPRGWWSPDLEFAVVPESYDCGEGLRLLVKAVEEVPGLDAAVATPFPSLRVEPLNYSLYRCVEERGLERCVYAAWLGRGAPDLLYRLLSSPPIYYIDTFERPDPCSGRRCVAWRAGTLVLLADYADVSDLFGRR